jgi:hypothetical protein
MSMTKRKASRLKKNAKKKVVMDVCNSCGKSFPEKDLHYGPDPYQSEINDNNDPTVLCDDCHQDSVWSI